MYSLEEIARRCVSSQCLELSFESPFVTCLGGANSDPILTPDFKSPNRFFFPAPSFEDAHTSNGVHVTAETKIAGTFNTHYFSVFNKRENNHTVDD